MNVFIFNHRDTVYEGYLETHHRYSDNDNMAVRLFAREADRDDVDAPFELYATLSVNTDRVLPENEFVFKMYSENHGLYSEIWRAGFIEPTGEFQSCGFAGPQPIVKLVPQEIKV